MLCFYILKPFSKDLIHFQFYYFEIYGTLWYTNTSYGCRPRQLVFALLLNLVPASRLQLQNVFTLTRQRTF